MKLDTLSLLTALEYLADSLLLRRNDRRGWMEWSTDVANQRGAIYFIWRGLPKSRRAEVAAQLRARNNRNRIVLREFLKYGGAA